MNPLVRFAVRKLDQKCQNLEAGIEADHKIPDDVLEDLDMPFQGAEGVPLAADIFRPRDRGFRPLPVVVMIHGGGLVVGTRKLSRTFCEKLAARGYLVFAPDYRRATETDAYHEIGDVAAAFSYVSGKLAEYGGDPVLHVRMLACFSGFFYTARKDPVGMVYAPKLYGKRRKDKTYKQYMNPECPEVMEHLPPVFLVGSDADFLKSYTKRYAKALRRAGHPCELVYYKDNRKLTHAFPALKPDLPESGKVIDQMLDWSKGLGI